MDTHSTNTFTGESTSVTTVDFSITDRTDTRCNYEVLRPDALRYNSLSKLIFVDDLYTMTYEQGKAFKHALDSVLLHAFTDPDECTDDPRNAYLAQGRRKLCLDQIRKLDNGNIAVGSAYEVTEEELSDIIIKESSILFPDDEDLNDDPDEEIGNIEGHAYGLIHFLGEKCSVDDLTDMEKGTLSELVDDLLALGVITQAEDKPKSPFTEETIEDSAFVLNELLLHHTTLELMTDDEKGSLETLVDTLYNMGFLADTRLDCKAFTTPSNVCPSHIFASAHNRIIGKRMDSFDDIAQESIRQLYRSLVPILSFPNRDKVLDEEASMEIDFSEIKDGLPEDCFSVYAVIIYADKLGWGCFDVTLKKADLYRAKTVSNALALSLLRLTTKYAGYSHDVMSGQDDRLAVSHDKLFFKP